MIQEARRVAVAYEFRCSGCSVLFRVIATVVAVEEISPQTAPEASIPHLSPIAFPRRNQAYSTPAITTTKNQIP